MMVLFAVQTYETAYAGVRENDYGRYEIDPLADVHEDDLLDLDEELYRGDDEIEAERIYDETELPEIAKLYVEDDDDEYYYCGGPYTCVSAVVCWRIIVDENGKEKREIKFAKFPEVKKSKAG